MARVSKEDLWELFRNGDKPNEEDFLTLLNECYNDGIDPIAMITSFGTPPENPVEGDMYIALGVGGARDRLYQWDIVDGVWQWVEVAIEQDKFYKVVGTSEVYIYDGRYFDVIAGCPDNGVKRWLDGDVEEILGASDEMTSGETLVQKQNFRDFWNGALWVVGDRMKIKNRGKTYIISNVHESITPADPVFSPSGTTDSVYNQLVYMSSSPAGYNIYYTTDGSTPTTASTKYTSAGVTLSQDKNVSGKTYTVKAIAELNGELSDSATTGTYTILRRLDAPGISFNGNEYSSARTCTLTSSDSADKIYYTTDGTDPTSGSSVYPSGGFVVYSSCTVKAMCVKSGWVDSLVSSTAVTLNTKTMYYGIVDNAPTAESGITALHRLEAKTLPQTIEILDSGIKKVCFAYAKTIKDVTSIKDASGQQYWPVNFTKTTVGDYKVYTMNSPADQYQMKYTFS